MVRRPRRNHTAAFNAKVALAALKGAQDHVLLVGDSKQHEAVETERPNAQLQKVGMKTVRLDEIVRQKDPELKSKEAITNLDIQGRVHAVQGHSERIAAIAWEYARTPENTLAVSPDNCSRVEINERIHAELQSAGWSSPPSLCGGMCRRRDG